MRLLRFLLVLVCCFWAGGFSRGPNYINLSQYTATFTERFTSFTATGSCPKGGSTWYWHVPVPGGDYGGVGANAFTVNAGVLTITLSNPGGGWQGGVLSTMDCNGVGFAQAPPAYYEMHAKFPPSSTGGASWPAGFLDTACHLPNPGTCPDSEFDFVEYFTNFAIQQINLAFHYFTDSTSVTGSIAGKVLTVTNVASGTVTVGQQVSGAGVSANTQILSQLTGSAGGIGTYALTVASTVSSEALSLGAYLIQFSPNVNNPSNVYHYYGVAIDQNWAVVYYDRYEVWRIPAQPNMQTPFYFLMALACSNLPDCTGTANPTVMLVDQVTVSRRNF